MTEPGVKYFRMYCEDEEKFVGKQTFEMTEKQAKQRNDAMPKWSTLRWKEVISEPKV